MASETVAFIVARAAYFRDPVRVCMVVKKAHISIIEPYWQNRRKVPGKY